MNVTKNIKKIYYNTYISILNTPEKWNIINCNEIISNYNYEDINIDQHLSNKVIIIDSKDWSPNSIFSVGLLKLTDNFHMANIIRSNNTVAFPSTNIFINTGSEFNISIDKYNNKLQTVCRTYGHQHTTLLSSVGLIWEKYSSDIIIHLLQKINRINKITLNKNKFSEISEKIYQDYIKLFDAYQTGIVNIISSSNDQKVVENISLSGSIISKIKNRSPNKWRTNNNKNWYENYQILIDDFIEHVVNIFKSYSLEINDYRIMKFNESICKIPIDFSRNKPKEMINVLILKEQLDIDKLRIEYNRNNTYGRIIKIVIYPNRFNEFIVKNFEKLTIPNSFGTYKGYIKVEDNGKIVKTTSLENALIISRCILEHSS
jgi:uncharacterized UPF0160 family protein